jgi:hypothetical protein
MIRCNRSLLLAVPLLFSSCFMDDCPINMGTPPATTVPRLDGGSMGPAVDIGSPGSSSGASWKMTYSSSISVTVHGPKKVTTKTILPTGVDQVGDCTINLGTFCALTNTVCPHKILPDKTAILQTSSAPSQPYIGFNRVGPLEPFKNQVGLVGSLAGTQLTVPLGTDGYSSQKGRPCALGQASVIRATVTDKAGLPASKAVLMQGTVTLAYSSDCFTLSGTSVVPSGTRVEMTVAFTGNRQ